MNIITKLPESGVGSLTLDEAAECLGVSKDTYTELWTVLGSLKPMPKLEAFYEASIPHYGHNIEGNWKLLSESARKDVIEKYDKATAQIGN